MATEVKLPRLGQGMESGTIVRWLKAEGDSVEKGEPLYELDTEKVTQEVEAEASGVLLKIAVSEGEVDVGHTVAVIGEQGEDVSSLGGGNGAGAAQKVDEDEEEEGSAAPAREEEREEGRSASSDFADAIGSARGNGASGPAAGAGAVSRGASTCSVRTGVSARLAPPAESPSGDSAGTFSPCSPIHAIVSPTGASPSDFAIFNSTPEKSDSTSCVTLSVSSS